METMICDICQHEWEAEVPPVPIVCPACGGTCRIKPPADHHQPKDKPGG